MDNGTGLIKQGQSAGMIPSAGGPGGGMNMLPQQTAAGASATAHALAMHQRAMTCGRDEIAIESELVEDFKHPGLGDIGVFEISFGGTTVRGLSIRAAEQIAHRWGHIITENTVTPMGLDALVHVSGIDLVSNVSDSAQALVKGTVERKKVYKDRELLGKRTNTAGDDVYIYPATEAEMFRECNSVQSKLKRNVILHLLPPNVRYAIFETSKAAKAGEFKENKREALNKLRDAFAVYKVSPKEISAYLGHAVGDATEAEFVELRQIYSGLKSGAVTWGEIVKRKQEADQSTESPEADGDTTLGADE